MSLVHQRTQAVQDVLNRVRLACLSLEGEHRPEQVDVARQAFLELAKRKELFPAEQFPYLYEGRSGFYRIGEDPDHLNALYIQVSRHNEANPPHKHPYWAIITGVQGDELNVLYERVDEGLIEGKGRLGEGQPVHIEPGVSLYIANKYFHTINVEGEQEGIHLHFYAIGADTREHREVERFRTPDSEEIYVKRGDVTAGVIGVQRISRKDLRDAQVSGQPVAVFKIAPQPEVRFEELAGLPTLTLDDIGPALERPSDNSTPIILVGDGPVVRLAADRLTRLGHFSTFWIDPAHV